MNTIDKFSGEYRFLSNFWLAEVEMDGLTYPCVENAYQAAKNFDRERRKMFLSLTPGQAKNEGRKAIMRPDWEDVKILIMTQLVRDKFNRNKSLQERLLQTGDLELVEGNTWGDTFWGVCNGEGTNHLGKVLMKVRAELLVREEARKSLKE
jgi:N-glycosidase YbiA